jgi:hypothetical protein
MTHSTLRKGAILVFAVLLTAGMVGPAVASNAAINYGADAAPQPTMEGDVTIADHQMGDSALTYNNDNGEWTELPGEVNESVDNPFSFTASDIAFDDAGAFPHSKDNTSALTASEWTGTASTADVETADNVDAVELDFSGNDHAEFSNFSVTSDENKRYLSVVMDATTVNSGAIVEFRVVDSDGDYYTAELNTSRSSGEDFMANSTGEGYVYQRQLGEMSLTTVGDGTFNDIEAVNVTETGGSAATVEISALNVDKTSAWDFGDELKDTDDDELETEQITEHKDGGALAVSDLESLGTAFESANIKDLTVPFQQDASVLDSEDVNAEFSDAEAYSNYESKFQMDVRFELPDAYDLSYSNLELSDTVSVPGSRYITVEYAEGTGDTDFDDISSWSDITSSYSSVGANVTVDSTIQPGSSLVVSYEYVVTGNEQSALENSGAAVGPTGSSGGGIIGWFTSLPGMIMSAFGAIIGFRLFKG